MNWLMHDPIAQTMVEAITYLVFILLSILIANGMIRTIRLWKDYDE